jgi:hypothetical protein
MAAFPENCLDFEYQELPKKYLPDLDSNVMPSMALPGSFMKRQEPGTIPR